MKIIKALKSKKYHFEKHGMSDKFIAEFIGLENIADDCIEDLQYYINQLYWETQTLVNENL